MVDCNKCKHFVNNDEACFACKHGESFEYINAPSPAFATIDEYGAYFCPHCGYRLIKEGWCMKCGAELVDEEGKYITQ